MVRVLTVGIVGPLEPYASGFAQALIAQGFKRRTAAAQLQLFAHVSRWLARHRLQAKHFTERRVLARYATYLSDERGLAQKTIYRLTDVARRFLVECGATRAVLRAVRPTHVRDFLRKVSRDYSPRSLAGF